MMTKVIKKQRNFIVGKVNRIKGEKQHETRHQMILKAAYYRAEKRYFLVGGELGDWLAAEREVDQRRV